MVFLVKLLRLVKIWVFFCVFYVWMLVSVFICLSDFYFLDMYLGILEEIWWVINDLDCDWSFIFSWWLLKDKF